MPFDQLRRASYEYSIVCELATQADDALARNDRDRCVALIQEIYGLLDLAPTARAMPDSPGE